MTAVARIIVFAGFLAVAALALAAGIDATGILIVAFVLAAGGIALAVVKKTESGVIWPARCPHCGGVISPNAPYCKHCAAGGGPPNEPSVPFTD